MLYHGRWYWLWLHVRSVKLPPISLVPTGTCCCHRIFIILQCPVSKFIWYYHRLRLVLYCICDHSQNRNILFFYKKIGGKKPFNFHSILHSVRLSTSTVQFSTIGTLATVEKSRTSLLSDFTVPVDYRYPTVRYFSTRSWIVGYLYPVSH